MTFEKMILQKALDKHVHRSDPRAGMRKNARAVHGAAADLSVDRHKFRSSIHHMRSRASASSSKKRSPSPPKKPDVGTLQLMTARSGDLMLKCRISKCIDLQGLGQVEVMDELKDFFQTNCHWRPMPLQILGPVIAEDASLSRPPTPRRDVGRMSGRPSPKTRQLLSPKPGTATELFAKPTDEQLRPAFQGKRRRRGILGEILSGARGDKEIDNDTTHWDFVRHFPTAAKARMIAEFRSSEGPAGQPTAKDKHTDVLQLQVLYSDVKALLEEFDEDCKVTMGRSEPIGKGVPSVLEFINDIPKVTQQRWAKILKVPADDGHDKEALARLLAITLRKEPTIFKLTSPKLLQSDISKDAASMLQLVHQSEEEDDSIYAQNQKMLGARVFLRDCDSHGGRGAREERFNGAMKWLRVLPEIGKVTFDELGFKPDQQRIDVIAKAVDRAESIRLRGRYAAVGDRTHCNSFGIQVGQVGRPTVKQRRGLGGLTADWLLDAIGQASDDEGLEEGDNLRLLAEISSFQPDDREAEDFATGSGDSRFIDDSWVSICRNLGLLSRRVSDDEVDKVSRQVSGASHEAGDPLRQISLVRQISEASPVSLVRQISDASNGGDPLRRISLDTVAMVQASDAIARGPEDEERQLEAVDEFDKIWCAMSELVGDLHEASCGPIILEVLLQLVSRYWPGHQPDEVVPGGSGSLVSALLWYHCGWDSPLGRKLVRRLCHAFNRYMEEGVLSKAGFIQLSTDAGWVTKRDISSRCDRLSKAFDDVVGDEEGCAEFGDFVLLVELVAHARSSNFELKSKPEDLALIPGHAKHWPFIERAVLQVSLSDEDPASPIWVRAPPRCGSGLSRAGSKSRQDDADADADDDNAPSLSRRGSKSLPRRESLSRGGANAIPDVTLIRALTLTGLADADSEVPSSELRGQRVQGARRASFSGVSGEAAEKVVLLRRSSWAAPHRSEVAAYVPPSAYDPRRSSWSSPSGMPLKELSPVSTGPEGSVNSRALSKDGTSRRGSQDRTASRESAGILAPSCEDTKTSPRRTSADL